MKHFGHNIRKVWPYSVTRCLFYNIIYSKLHPFNMLVKDSHNSTVYSTVQYTWYLFNAEQTWNAPSWPLQNFKHFFSPLGEKVCWKDDVTVSSRKYFHQPSPNLFRIFLLLNLDGIYLQIFFRNLFGKQHTVNYASNCGQKKKTGD